MTKKTRCSKCQRLFFTLTARRDGTRSLTVPAYGISMALLDPTKFTYVLTCTKCGNREVHVVPVEPPLQSPAHLGGRANALTGGLAFTGLPDADPPPADTPGDADEQQAESIASDRPGVSPE